MWAILFILDSKGLVRIAIQFHSSALSWSCRSLSLSLLPPPSPSVTTQVTYEIVSQKDLLRLAANLASQRGFNLFGSYKRACENAGGEILVLRLAALTYIQMIQSYIQKCIYARWPQQLGADFHEGRDFRKNIQINITKLYKKKTKKEGITIQTQEIYILVTNII
jgi:hypothetical protein